jgi:ornithine cyclodeaminase/alanine dehydrogenase-like protein (mu-crystallin family)
LPLLVLSAPDVHRLLGYPDCVAVMRSALSALAAGRADQPLRVIIRPGHAPGLMGVMPAYLAPGGGPGDPAAGSGGYGLKAITVTPGNPGAGLDAHQGVVLLSDGSTGVPLAVLNASAVTEIRTAAMSVLATDLLARPGAGDLAVIGAGVQARAHIRAFSQTRPLRRIRVAGRDPERTAKLAADLQPEIAVPITACPSAADAVAGADIIVTATSSAEPVLRRAWIADGAHVNAVGASLPAARELDGATVGAAALYCDSRAGLTSESGDYRLAVADGLAGPEVIRGELGEVLAGSVPGRLGDGEITVFESLGLAVEDLAAALRACELAAAAGAGQRVEF